MPQYLRGLVLAGALVLAGCSLGGQEARKPAEQQAISKEQLAAMVLPRAELGTIAEGLKPNGSAGPVGNGEAADDSLDPEDTARSLRSAGRLNGHKGYFTRPSLATWKKGGVVMVGTEVELMEDPVYAAQYLHEQLGDFQRYEGKQDDGTKLSGVSSFAVNAVGDEAEGLLFTVSGKRTGYATAVAFRRDRIVAFASVLRADKDDAQAEARALAIKLDERIKDVLAGRLAPVEAPPAEEAQQVSFAGKEKLPELTMTPKDLGQGHEPISEGVTEGEGYVGYQRTFGETVVGSSHLITVRAETRLYETTAAAARTFRQLTRTAREVQGRAMVKAFADQSGLRAADIRVQALAKPRRGTAGIVVTFDLSGAEFRIVSILMRSGRMVETVSGVCRAAAFDPDDLKPVADRAHKRLAA
jgi:hypothetical protein